MAKLIETPVLALRDQWFPSRSRALVLEVAKTANPGAVIRNRAQKITDSVSRKKLLATGNWASAKWIVDLNLSARPLGG